MEIVRRGAGNSIAAASKEKNMVRGQVTYPMEVVTFYNGGSEFSMII
jgi:hypothetical protein